MKKAFLWGLASCIVDIISIVIGFGVIYVVSPSYTGDISILYGIGLAVGIVIWVVGHFLFAYITRNK